MAIRHVIGLLFFFAPLQANAGAWLQPRDHGQLILQLSRYSSSQFFDMNGQLIDQPRYGKYELQPYAEYGLRDNLTIGATGYLQHVTQSGESNNGLADPEFFARTHLWKSETSLFSIQPLIKLHSAFESPGNPRGGSRSTDLELSALYGRNLHILSDHDYLDTRVGYRYRSGRLNDQWRTDAALGLEPAPNWMVIPAIRTVIATKYNPAATFSENGDQDYDLFKIEVGAHYRFARGQTAGVTLFDHLYGAQTGNGIGVTLSFLQEF